MPIYALTEELIFPPVSEAEEGILAVGGDLSAERLELAYRSGIFPWFSEDEPIIWWSPDLRFVLFPDELKISKSMKPLFKRKAFQVTYNEHFEEVIENCKSIQREGQDETWITPEMKAAYIELHKKGLAKSVEVWLNNELVGGLYGVQIGDVFCGESMFAKVSNASKYGFISFVKHFQEQGGKLVDCQVYTKHLESLGARDISREEFLEFLQIS